MEISPHRNLLKKLGNIIYGQKTKVCINPSIFMVKNKNLYKSIK